MYKCKTPIGTFLIIRNDDQYDLMIGDYCFGSYDSAISAADDVYTKTTGCYEWDMSNYEGPTDLSEWIYLP